MANQTTPAIQVKDSNVGIGTTSPAYKLDVNVASNSDALRVQQAGASKFILNGDGVMTWGASAANGVLTWDTNIVYIGGLTNNALGIWAGGSEKVRITTGGNVGIGTTSPAVRLDVVGANSTEGQIYVGNTNVEYSAGINFTTSGTNRGFVGWRHTYSTAPFNLTGIHLFNTDNSNIVFGTNNLVRAVIDTNGNVGIGTTAPTSKFQVNNNAGTGYAFYVDAGNPSGTTTLFEHTGANTPVAFAITKSGYSGSSVDFGILYIDMAHSVVGGGSNMHFTLRNSAGNLTEYGGLGASIVTNTAGATAGRLNFYTTNGGATRNIRMVINPDGNVGIGTTAPGSALHVVSGGVASQGTTGHSGMTSPGIWIGGDGTNGLIYGRNSGSWVPTYLDSSALYINAQSGGNVGIGTTAPATKLEVYGGHNNTTARLYSTGDGASSNASLDMWASEPGVTYDGSGIGNNVNGHPYYGRRNALLAQSYIRFYNGGILLNTGSTTASQTVTVLASGNVGIGTTAPGAKLQVEGANPFIRVNNTSADDHGIKISYNGSDAHGLHLLYNANSAVSYIDNTYQAVSGQVYGNIYIRQNVGGTMTSRITIKADGGNVGIGTTAPSEKLELSASGNIYGKIISTTTGGNAGVRFLSTGAREYGIFTDGDLRFYDFSASAERMRITSAGNVGIGTTAPSSKLHIYQSNSEGIYLDGLQEYTTFKMLYGGNQKAEVVYQYSADQMYFNKFGTGTFAFYGGNVGIGASSPTEQLHVGGNVIVTYNNSYQGINSVGNKAILARVSPTTGIINYAEYATATNLNGFVMGSDDARVKGNIATDSLEFITNTSTRMTILSNGDVGINNTNPSRKLDVTGEARVVSTSNLAMFIKTSSGFGAGISYEDSTTGGNDVVYAGAIGAAFFIATGAAERVRVLSGGNVGIATNNPLSRLHVVGDARIASGSLGVGVAPNATDGRVDASNDIVAYSTSDQRLKENVMPIENALEKVKTLTGVEFDWKEKTAHVHGYHGHDVGIIAQDVQAVLPEAVRTNESGYLSVRYEKMIALLIEANKELAARVEELEKKLK